MSGTVSVRSRAVWWAKDWTYAAVWQVRGVFSRRRPTDFLTGTKTPVIVLPGIYETWHFMLPLITALHNDGHPVHVIAALHRNRRPVAFGAGAVIDHMREQNLSSVVIVAHSKGGLIGKQVMMLLEAERVEAVAHVEAVEAAEQTERAAPVPTVERMLAVCSPFLGSRYASYLLLPSLRAFRAKDPVIVALAANEEANSRIVSLFGHFDPHIPEGSELPGAQNVLVDTGGHFRILADPVTIAAALRVADAAE